MMASSSSQEAPPPQHEWYYCGFRLADLPLELIQMIGYHVLWPHGFRQRSRWGLGQKDLSHLSRTCKLFQALLQPMLFQQFSLVDRYQWPNGTLIRLVAALKERPDLAQRMKSVSIYVNWSGQGEAPSPDGPVDAARLAALARKVIDDGLVKLVDPCSSSSSLRAARKHLMPQYYWEGDDYTFRVLVQLVLLHAPNVELLHLGMGFLRNHVYSSKAQVLPNLKYLISEPNPFHHYEYDEAEFFGGPDVLYDLNIKTPNLQELWIPTVHSFPEETVRDNCSLVRLRRLAITLYGSYAKSKTVENILHQCPGLEAISLSLSMHFSAGFVGIICQELHARADTLRTIQLDVDSPLGVGNDYDDDVWSYFQNFNHLEILEISSYLLEAWCSQGAHRGYTISAFLPANMQQLTIWLANVDHCPCLLDALADFMFVHLEQGAFPRLEKIVLAPPPARLSLKADTDTQFANAIRAWEAVVRDRRGGVDDDDEMKPTCGRRVEIEWTSGLWAGEVFDVGS